MRQIHGLEKLRREQPMLRNARQLADWLLVDLQDSRCEIYGVIGDDDNILLAALAVLPETLVYDMFDQRVDLTVAGKIIRNDCVPLTYRLQGGHLALSGRCSVIPKVCGVDLYLQSSYTCVIGDIARQNFSIEVKPLLRLLSS